jgi:hypothetical protein
MRPAVNSGRTGAAGAPYAPAMCLVCRRTVSDKPSPYRACTGAPAAANRNGTCSSCPGILGNIGAGTEFRAGEISSGTGGTVGGFIGTNAGESGDTFITAVYASTPSLDMDTVAVCLGGFAGQNGDSGVSSVTNAYWATDTSGVSNAVGSGSGCASNATGGITGETSTSLTTSLPGLDDGDWAQSASCIGDLPYLVNNPPPGCALLARRPFIQNKSVRGSGGAVSR